MIKVKHNPNFKGWFQIFKFEELIDEVKKESKALNLAKKASQEYGDQHISFLGKLIKAKTK